MTPVDFHHTCEIIDIAKDKSVTFRQRAGLCPSVGPS